MTKKMKKAIALIAASVLCLSMSVNVFAAESPVDPVIPDENQEESLPQFWGGMGTDKDGNKVTVMPTYEELSKEVEEVLKDEDKMKEVLSNAGYEVDDKQNVVVLGAMDIELKGQDMPEGGIDVSLTLDQENPQLEGLKDGDTLYVLHQKHDGTWEVLEGKLVITTESYEYEGEIYEFSYATVDVHFDSLSPVAIVKVMSDGKVVVLDKDEKKVGTIETSKENGEGTATVKTAVAKKSPKTGN